MGYETELKFRLDKAALDRLRRHPLIRRLKRRSAITRQEKSVYFDTGDGYLRAHQSVLRVRSVGQRRVQTLKSVDLRGGAWRRHEWQWEIFDDLPDCRLLENTPFANAFPYARLQPIFSTEIRRTTVLLGAPGWQVECAFDEGSVRAGDQTCPVNEVELELKEGDTGALFQLAQDLFREVPGILSPVTKSERGFALLDRSGPKPAKAMPVVLDPGLTSAEAFRRIALSCVNQLLANQDTLAATADPEAVHQMRVAVRRLKAAMSLFKAFLDTPETAAVKERLRWLQEYLGPARDAEVFIAEILDPLPAFLTESDGFVHLRQQFIDRRERSMAAASGLPGQGRMTEALLRLGGWAEGGDWYQAETGARREALQRPAAETGLAALTKRDRKVVKGMAKLEKLDDHSRHILRIHIKKLRYSIDFFSSLHSIPRAKKASAALGTLQDVLGLLNDIAVARDLLRNQAKQNGDKTSLWTAGMIAGWHAARQPQLLRQAAEDWKAYDRMPRFWIE